MDDVDRKILAELQADGRLTLTELADRVRLSVSPCHRRLRTLERSGAIAGYHAQLDASVLGLTFEALVFVTMRYADRQTVAAFEEHVADIPNVLQAQRLFGDPDYLLRVVARDLPAYRELYDERLATLPGVLRVSSTLVMKSVVDARPLHIIQRSSCQRSPVMSQCLDLEGSAGDSSGLRPVARFTAVAAAGRARSTRPAVAPTLV